MQPATQETAGARQTRFVTTRWSQIHLAGYGSEEEAAEALNSLCQAYWGPLYAFTCRLGHDSHQAKDFVQAFLLHFIEHGYLRAADRARGRFRTFLLTSFRHYLAHEWEKTRTLKRGGGFEIITWEEHHAALDSRLHSSPGVTPEFQFDHEWALTLLGRAFQRLEAEHAAADRQRSWEILGRFLHQEASTGDYERAAAELGCAHRTVKLSVHRLRRRLGRFVREEVRETVVSEADAADELDYLMGLISG